MKTLIIHPKDETTDFLKVVYESQPSYIKTKWTIIRDNISKRKMVELLKEHSRIIMLGHGTDKGLMGFNRYMIEGKHVYLLREKQLYSIWCYASNFMNKHKLSGFSTGMFISEPVEAEMLNIDASADEINESNNLFANLLAVYINNDSMYEKMIKYYDGNSSTIQYNRALLEYRE